MQMAVGEGLLENDLILCLELFTVPWAQRF